MKTPSRLRDRRGFTLIEALIAVALMGLVLAVLGRVTGQWLPAWHAGFTRLQRTDLLGLGLDRIAADLAAAEFVSLSGATYRPFFVGSPSSVTFVRSALGPNTPEGVEVVRIAEIDAPRGVTLMRTHAPFKLRGQVSAELKEELGPDVSSDEVALVRPPFRIAFAYAGSERSFRDTWHNKGELPSAVRITITSAETGQQVAATTVALVHAGAPAICVRAASPFSCIDELARTGEIKAETVTDAPANASPDALAPPPLSDRTLGPK